MATVTTSTGSRSRLSQKRLTRQQHGEPDSASTVNPALHLQYSHSVNVSFQVEPQRLISLLPKGLVPDLMRSNVYVNLAATHYKRSGVWGLPLVPSFCSLVLSTCVRAKTDASRRGKYVFKRFISRSLAAWHLKKKLKLQPAKADLKWELGTAHDNALPAVNFFWKAAEADNFLKVKSKSRIAYPQDSAKVTWILDHRSEFAIHNSNLAKSSTSTSAQSLVLHNAAPDPNCTVYDVAQAGFKCGTTKLFGAEFSQALQRRPSSVFLFCQGDKAYSEGVTVHQKG